MTEMKTTYVTLLSTPDYLDGVKVLYKSLKKHSDIPLLCVCSQSLPDECVFLLEDIGIKCHKLSKSVFDLAGVKNFVAGARSHWQYTFDKLLIWELTQYDKIVFLDADMMVCDNIDILFDSPDISAVQSDRVMNPGAMHLNSGMMVIVPNKDVLKRLIDNVVPTIIHDQYQQVGVGDQNVIINTFCNWSEEMDKHLPIAYNLYFKDITCYMRKYYKLYGKSKIIHFSADRKPWFKVSLKINLGMLISLFEHNIMAIRYFVRYKLYLGRLF